MPFTSTVGSSRAKISRYAWIVDWFQRYQRGEDVRQVSLAEIEKFMAIDPRPK